MAVAICERCVPFKSIRTYPVLATETFITRDSDWYIQRTRSDEPAEDGDSLITSVSTFQADIITELELSGEPDYTREVEVRTFVSHNAALPNATHVLFSCRVYGTLPVSGNPWATPLLYAIYQGNWGGGVPAWGSVGGLIASGSVNPDSELSSLGDHDDVIQAIVPIVDGRVQLVMSFSPSQNLVNGIQTGPVVTARARWPDFEMTWGQGHDILLTAHPAFFPDSSRYYLLEYVEALGSGEPFRGQPIQGEQVATGDGTTTTFTTDYPYTPLSLEVEVDGVRVGADETDPAAGSFTLSFAPEDGEQIVVTYQYGGSS